jgi:hypothetical protein
MNVSLELIEQMGRQLQNFSIDERRCAELALEIARLTGTVLDASSCLDFNNDPADFRGLLERRSR